MTHDVVPKPDPRPTRPTDDLARSRCLDPGGRPHGRRDADDPPVIDRLGKAGHRPRRCRACKDRLAEFTGTPLFDSRLPHRKVLAIPGHLAEGCGIRHTARLDQGPAGEARTDVTMSGYDFCWAVRTPRVKREDGPWRRRSAAMAAGPTDHLRTWREWLTRPSVQPE